MNNIKQLISTIKNDNEDFEFYPTTDEIIQKLISDLDLRIKDYSYRGNVSSFLDIGAGNGKVLNVVGSKFSNIELYAIEKSEILRNNIDKSIYVIGTNFLEQSLIDKNIGATFCNPPYSQYEQWTTKIIRESVSRHVYLVIPTRWKENDNILSAINYRDARYTVIGEFNFNNSERQARTTVNLIRFDLTGEEYDPFDRLFKDEFSELLDKFNNDHIENEEGKPEEEKGKFSHLVPGKNYIETLVKMYREEIKHIKKNYKMVEQLDANLLREFEIFPNKICKMLHQRLKGLKNLYWNELISRMNEITNRLTTKKRKTLLNKIQQNGNVDFTEDNIYAVVVWLLKNANSFIEDQLLETYAQMINKANCKNYKSNKKVYEFDRWRYEQENPTHFCLEYRLVIDNRSPIHRDPYFKQSLRISEYGVEFLSDLLTVANNLGFECNSGDYRLHRWNNEHPWKPGQAQEFYCRYEGKKELLLEAKGYLNRNLHLRLNQKFALALNVEYGRLKGWIHSKEEASTEIQDVKAGEYFKTNCMLIPETLPMIEYYSSDNN